MLLYIPPVREVCVYVEHSLGEESKIHCEHSRLQITCRHLFIWKLKFVLSAFRSTCHTFTSWAVSWEWQCSMATTSMGALLYPSTNSCWVNPSPWMTWSLLILTCTTVLSGSCTYKSEQRSFSFHFFVVISGSLQHITHNFIPIMSIHVMQRGGVGGYNCVYFF